MKVSIVIPNFNGGGLLEKNLPRVLFSVKDAEVIVVDDASTDNSLSVLKTNFPKVKVVERRTNDGFASAVNDGVQNASGDLILLLNSDVIPEVNFLPYLISHFTDSQIFAVGCLQKSRELKGTVIQGRGVGKFANGFLVHGPGSPEKTNTLWVFGGAAMYRKDIWKKLGGMDILYNPFYWEDIDLSYRALKAGYELVFDARSIVNHDQMSGAIRSLYTPEEIHVIALRNQILFVWLNITDFYLLVSHFAYLFYNLLKAVLSGNFVFINAFFRALSRIFPVFHSRMRNKKMAVMTDRELLSKVAR